MNPAEELWELHSPDSGYPPGVLAVPTPIVGTAFFPGGFGLWNPSGRLPLPRFPIGGVMVLGHDFHSEEGYRESVDRGCESGNQPTWRNLLQLFQRVEILPEDCFFTNVFMGLRAGSETTGVFPGASNEAFVQHCKHFLLRQLETQRPSLVITLGITAPWILSSLSPQLFAWAERPGLRYLNTNPVQGRVSFRGLPDFFTTVVAIIHPSLRSASLRHRTFQGLAGDAAEIGMLTEAKKRAGLR
jgi:hypothetical protein